MAISRQKKQRKKDLTKMLQKALNESASVKKSELESLIKDYHPEYASLLQSLQHLSESTVELSQKLAKPTTPVPKSLKRDVLPFYLGYDHQGYINAGLASFPHMVLGGTTGVGKSNFLRHLVSSFSKLNSRQVIVIDSEQVDYNDYVQSGSIKLFDTEDALATIKSLVGEMATRKELFLSKGYRNLKDWQGVGKPKRIVLILDEYADLYKIEGLQDSLSHLARKGGK